eukprot:m.98972 g.98972  ORF g.98972 m.98972 type:complete len:206 (-) comp15309_c0_seq1:95-712(-)
MVQWLNVVGIVRAVHVMVRPSLGMPHVSAQSIAHVDFGKLREAGITAVLFDKDNCITLPYQDSVFPPLKGAWEKCCKEHFPGRVAILSNSAGSQDDVGGVEAARLESTLGVPVLRHDLKKPACGQDALAHFDCDPAHIAVVGDRLLTDVVMANLNGMLAIHTEPLANKGDTPPAVAARALERRLLATWRACGVTPPIHPAAMTQP